MLILVLEAIVLIGLVKTLADEEVNLFPAILLALGAAIGTNVLVLLLIEPLGLIGFALGLVASGFCLAMVLSNWYGMSLKMAGVIAGIYMVVHIGLSFLLLSIRG